MLKSVEAYAESSNNIGTVNYKSGQTANIFVLENYNTMIPVESSKKT